MIYILIFNIAYSFCQSVESKMQTPRSKIYYCYAIRSRAVETRSYAFYYPFSIFYTLSHLVRETGSHWTCVLFLAKVLLFDRNLLILLIVLFIIIISSTQSNNAR